LFVASDAAPPGSSAMDRWTGPGRRHPRRSPGLPGNQSHYIKPMDISEYKQSHAYMGRWTLENNLAVYKHWHGKTDRYDRPSLEVAIQNVKNNRNFYATPEAYQRDCFHFERGLGLFKAAEAAHQAT
jgi:hypothetical protein